VGIDINALKFLLSAMAAGTDARQTMMIGRQRLYVDRPRLGQLVGEIPPENEDRYAEWLFRRLGAAQVDSLDHSAYEGATVLHDMNTPLPGDLAGRYSLVFDAGTLEHIFNFPVAIRNCMELLAPGGQLICCTVANNFCGHGFYQFSPELFYRVLSEENGFLVERILACDAFRESEWYRVSDPALLGRRVEIIGPYAVMLLVQARKTGSVQPFRSAPQQSDYESVWRGDGTQHADHRDGQPRDGQQAPPFSLRSLISRCLPRRLVERIRDARSAGQYPADCFSRTDERGNTVGDKGRLGTADPGR
jgi:hypothetical protein